MKLNSPEHDKLATGLVEKYHTNRGLTVGSAMNCPTCGRAIVKKTYHHVFCKKKRPGRSNCKDQYWNITNPRGIEGGFTK